MLCLEVKSISEAKPFNRAWHWVSDCYNMDQQYVFIVTIMLTACLCPVIFPQTWLFYFWDKDSILLLQLSHVSGCCTMGDIFTCIFPNMWKSSTHDSHKYYKISSVLQSNCCTLVLIFQSERTHLHVEMIIDSVILSYLINNTQLLGCLLLAKLVEVLTSQQCFLLWNPLTIACSYTWE